MKSSFTTKRKTICTAVILFIITAILIFSAVKGKSAENFTMFAMDTSLSVTQYGDSDFSQVKSKVKQLDSMISAYGNGEISKLNKNGTATLSDSCQKLISESIELTEKYGLCDVTAGTITKLWNIESENPVVPSQENVNKALKSVGYKNISLDKNICTLKNGSQLDFGCDGKGYALDELKSIYDKKKTSCAIVSFGSSSLLYGKKPNGTKFSVAVKNPENASEQCITFKTDACTISTSGGYERFFKADGKKYIHIFDLVTGKPTQTDLTSVTVLCESGIKSDFLSTCIFIGGTENLSKWLSDSSIKIIAIDKNKKVYCSESLKDTIEITDKSFAMTK